MINKYKTKVISYGGKYSVGVLIPSKLNKELNFVKGMEDLTIHRRGESLIISRVSSQEKSVTHKKNKKSAKQGSVKNGRTKELKTSRVRKKT